MTHQNGCTFLQCHRQCVRPFSVLHSGGELGLNYGIEMEIYGQGLNLVVLSPACVCRSSDC